VTPEDRLARQLTGLDQLPRGVRRLLAVLLSLLLFGVLVGSVILAASPQRPAHRSSSSDAERLQHSSRPGLSAARDRARRFLRGYLAYSYGHRRVSAIRDADPVLLRALEDQRVPPAARKRQPRIMALHLRESTPGVALATGTVADGSGIRYPLVFYLERRSRGWVVTRLAD
jgi:hypothetical protein